MTADATTGRELDVRALPKPGKHPAIFAAYAELPAGGSFVLVNDHDPKHLREEFEADHGGSFGWEYLAREARNWRIKITKLTSTPLPQVLASTTGLAAQTSEPAVAGAVWKLEVRDRDLDSNIIAIPTSSPVLWHGCRGGRYVSSAPGPADCATSPSTGAGRHLSWTRARVLRSDAFPPGVTRCGKDRT
jgi:uncharacterized protein (DUF2249 family)